MRALSLFVLLAAAACSGPDVRGAPPARGVDCGRQSCGPAEYCVIECTCCGTRPPEPGEATARYRCEPIPDGCDPASMCGCPGLASGLCNPGRRTVETPCA